MKVLDYIFVALLTITALLQLNDPDPAYWVLVYGLGAGVPLLNSMNKQNQYLAALAIGMTISGMMYAAPGVVEYFQSGNWSSIAGSMDGPAAYVEPAREFIGLLMQLVVVSCYSWQWRSR